MADPNIMGTGWKGATDTNWTTSTNWDNTDTPSSGDRNLFYGVGFANAGGTGNTTSNNDLTNYSGYRITFETVSNPVSFTLGGNAISLYDYSSNDPKIENDSTAATRTT